MTHNLLRIWEFSELLEWDRPAQNTQIQILYSIEV